nr:hypothetical protein [Tanacetum cinerariifolium]
MAENQTMAQLLQASTDGYEDAIVIPEIAATNFELKHGLINLVQNKQFFGNEKEDPHAHLRYFTKITSTMRLKLHLLLLLRSKLLNRIVLPAVVITRTKTVPRPAETFIKTTFKRSGTLPGNTVTNPKEDLKGTEVTKDQVQTSSSQSTAPVQPTVTQSKPETPVSEPVVTPVSASMPNLKPSIPYPSRRDNERRRDQANEQIEKFYEIFKEMSFDISFTDALMLMPKFASTLKALIGNKEKLRMDECLALADIGASINLMPLSVWKGLSLPELTPTCMTLELADRMESKPVGIAKDVKVKVGMFHFPADFVVVDFKPDPRVPLILGQCFLKNCRALINVHKGELTLRIGNEAITYNLDQTSRYSANYDQMTTNKIDVTDEACEEYSDPSPPLSNHEKPVPSFKEELKACEAKTIKSSIDEPPEVELKDLPPHLEYAFLEGDNKLPVIIAKALKDKEKSGLIKVLKSHKRAIAWKLSDIQGINPKFCTHKILMEEDYKPAVQN